MKTNLLKSIFISLILLVGATNAWAANASNAIVYYDNTASNWSDVQILIGHSTWSSVYKLSKIDGTNNLYCNTSLSWGDYSEFYFVTGASSWGDEGNSPTHRKDYVTNYSAKKTTSLGSNKYLYVSSGTSKGASLTETKLNNGYSDLNYTQTVQQHLSTDNGSNYSTSTLALATVKVSSKKLKSDNATEDSPGTIASGNSSATCSAARTATVTYNVSSVKTGYDFVGWYDGTTQKSTSTTYTYNATEAKTITARFKVIQYTITYGVFKGTGGSIKLNNGDEKTAASNTANLNHGSDANFTAIPSTGYKIEGWYSDENCTTPLQKGNETYNERTITSAKTVYVKFVEIPTYDVDIKATTGGTVSPEGKQKIGEANVTITAEASHGYNFDGWDITGGVAIADKNATTTTITATADGTVTAQFSVITRNIAIKSNNDTYGTVSPTSVTATIADPSNSFTATPEDGYHFVKWTATSGITLADANSATTNINQATTDGTVTATFEETKYTIGVVSSNVEFGTVSTASISVGQHTASANITATEKTGCEFVGWIATDGIIITSPSNKTTTIKATKEGTLTAIFKEKPANTVYFKPQSWWKDSDARTAIWAWKENGNPAVEGWVDVDYDDCTGNILRAEIPAKYDRIKFVRLKPSSADGYNGENNGYNWNNEWNSTETLIVPTDNKNLYDMTSTKYIYLKPNTNWQINNAKFEAYFSGNNGEDYVTMTSIGNGIWRCDRKNRPNIKFNRVNPSNGYDKWNSTQTLSIPTTGDMYTIDESAWSDGDGSWSTLLNSDKWTTYIAPTFNVTINPCENGTITVVCNDQTCTSSTENVTIPNVTIHTELNIIFTPADGYILTTPLVTYADVVADNIYSICGPTVISAEFVPQGTTKTIYLRPNDDWLKDGAIFIAHAWKDGSSDLHDYLMTTKDDDYTGSYSCTIDSKYDHVLFARINPEYKDNQELRAEWMWNKTIDLQITDDVLNENGYRFAIKNKNGDLYDGEWEENTPIWGLTADFNLWHAEDAIFRGYPGKVDILLHSKTHQFLLYNIKTEEFCRNNGTYTRGNSGQWWTMNEQNNCKLVADVDNALYHFQMQYVTQVGEFKKQISITYPNTDVYYLAYQEGEDSKSFRKSHAIDKITEGEKQDTISFFVNVDNTPYLYLLDHAGNVLAKHFITGTGGADPNNAMLPGKRNSDATLYVGAGCGVENTGVYNFILLQEGNEAQIDAAATHLYTGSYYIRTDASEGGWNAFRQKSNQITYSSFANSHSNFNHYYCKYIEAGSNVKFTIANDYSYCISDTLDNDAIIEPNQSSLGCLPDNANVRFGWDSKNNKISRAYIKGAGKTSDRFLVLQGNEHLEDANGGVLTEGGNGTPRYGLQANEEILVDQQNWIYQVDVTANKQTLVKLIAEYNGTTQYFKGNETEYTGLLSGTASDTYKIRLIYDFKSNHLVTAWLAGGNTVQGEKVLGADMMVIRKDQRQAEQLNFDPTNSKMNEVGTGYAVMTFTKAHLENLQADNETPLPEELKKTERERSLYWVSFPFDVKISDVFGFGEYAEHWIIQYYDGAERAEKGLFSDSGTYWKYIFDTDTELKAGKGYVLVLDLSKVEFLHGATEVSLYFPSTNPLTMISGELTEATVPEHLCKIDREWTENGTTYHHKWTDSHWNLIGVPGFADIQDFDVTAYYFTQYDLSFYYAFDLKKSTYTVASEATNFQAMYSYMVQFAGTINWSTTPPEVSPAELAARRNSNSDEPERVALRLELAQGEEVADRTFVQLQQEGATANFDLSLDLTKIMNSGFSNIYTLTDSLKIQVAGNALPMEETVVPVGVNIATAGEYTFRMPDGTEGMVVELIDYEANTTTNLLLDDYTVNLPTGSNETRFALSIKPEKTATNVGNIGGTMNDGQGIRKFIIDGKLYLQKDGMLYDAQGHIVR